MMQQRENQTVICPASGRHRHGKEGALLRPRRCCTMSSAILVLMVLVSPVCSAWTVTTTHEKAFRPTITTTNTPSTPTHSSSTPRTVQNMLKNPGIATPPPLRKSRGSTSKLSNSVLASCDTLPAFPTAHGLLSPETVMRMKVDMPTSSPAMARFLRTYQARGPLACMKYLSDPDVLPHLTAAMRDIAA